VHVHVHVNVNVNVPENATLGWEDRQPKGVVGGGCPIFLKELLPFISMSL